ncbi:MAG: O-antigen ligase family protein, partial [Kiritimatiellia bacterium]
MNPDASPLKRPLTLMLLLGTLLLGGLTLLPQSASLIWDLRWYPLYLLATALICLGVFAVGWESKQESPPPDWMPMVLLTLISLGLTFSALAGPFPRRTLIYSFSPLAALFVGVVLLSRVRPQELFRFLRSGRFQGGVAVFLLLFSLLSLQRYLSQQLLPFLAQARQLDEAAGGGIYDLLLQKNLSTLPLRNGSPFGHPNYNSGFLLLTLPLLGYGIFFPAGKFLRGLSLTALGLGLTVLISTQSRNALLGLGVAVAMAVWWNHLQRKRTLQILGALAAVGGILLWSVPRFQQMLTSVSPARQGMWQAAWLTGLRYFPLGSGEGLTPEMLQLFSPQLSSIWDNSIQFHHTWLHLWAVGGVLAAAGVLGLTVWILIRVLFSSSQETETRRLATPSVMALSASFILFWADYQLDLLPVSLLLFAHVALLSDCTGNPRKLSGLAGKFSRRIWILPALCLLISVGTLPASLRSRQKIDQAGLAVEQGDLPAAVSGYLAAYETAPEPYSLNMAAVLLSANPAQRREAITLFEKSLELWESQILVHEYLTSLWMQEAAAAEDGSGRSQALQKAYIHAKRRTEIAPRLQGTYLDLALVTQKLSGPESEITGALLLELLNQGDLLFPQIWTALGPLQAYRDPVFQALMCLQAPEDPLLRNRIRFLQGFLELTGQLPSGTGSAEVQQQTERWMRNSPAFQLLSAVCEAEEEEKVPAMKRLLVYLFEAEVSEG